MPSNIIYLVCHSTEMPFSYRYASLYDEFCDGLLTRRVTVIDGTPYKTTRQSPDHPTFGRLHYFGYLDELDLSETQAITPAEFETLWQQAIAV